MILDTDTVHGLLNGAVAAALGFIGNQFRKNRRAGRERDGLVQQQSETLKAIVASLAALEAKQLELIREVDRDRVETRFNTLALQQFQQAQPTAAQPGGRP